MLIFSEITPYHFEIMDGGIKVGKFTSGKVVINQSITLEQLKEVIRIIEQIQSGNIDNEPKIVPF